MSNTTSEQADRHRRRASSPPDSIIYRLIDDIREWHAAEPDWRKTREQIAANYGYDKYGGNCHMVPNHALIILALLYGDDDFQKSLMIVNTCGWDTDCNSGNVGCLLGIKNGLAGIDAGPDWRGPVADRLYLATADGGRAHHRRRRPRPSTSSTAAAPWPAQAPIAPKDGARFHFELPGAVQGFMPEDSPEVRGAVTVENVAGHSAAGSRSLALRYAGLAPGRPARVATPTFIPSRQVADYFLKRGYALYRLAHALCRADAAGRAGGRYPERRAPMRQPVRGRLWRRRRAVPPARPAGRAAARRRRTADLAAPQHGRPPYRRRRRRTEP